MDNKMEIDLGFAVLEIEKNPDPLFNKEIFIGLRTKEGYYQDIAMIGRDYDVTEEGFNFKDNVCVLVWGDTEQEDYTHKFEIGLCEEYK